MVVVVAVRARDVPCASLHPKGCSGTWDKKNRSNQERDLAFIFRVKRVFQIDICTSTPIVKYMYAVSRVVARLENLENLEKSGNLILPWKTWKNQGISLLCLEKRFFFKN